MRLTAVALVLVFLAAHASADPVEKREIAKDFVARIAAKSQEGNELNAQHGSHLYNF